MSTEELLAAARKAAVAACGFVAMGESDLATTVLGVYLAEVQAAGYSRFEALNALVGVLISTVVTVAEPAQLRELSLEMGLT